MSENKIRAIFRVRYPQLKRLLLRFRGSDKSNRNISSSNVPSDVIRVGEVFGLLETNDDIALTNKGREMLLAYENNQEGNERRILRMAFEKNRQLRLHWAMICDNRELFTVRELVETFRDMGYSDLSESSLMQYIRAFVDWAEVTGLCAKEGIKGHTYKIFDRMTVGASTTEEKAKKQVAIAIEQTNPEMETNLGIFKLNSYICDYLADQTHEGDLDIIKNEIEKLRGNRIIDDLTIDMLERFIKTALDTKSTAVFAAVAQSLRSLRKKYIEEGQLS
jgi:hypothetical protein